MEKFKAKNKITKIYVDLDGVLADFEKRYIEQYHIKPREAEKNKQFDKYFEEFINTKQFATLDKMPDADVLLQYLDSLPITKEILSSTASEDRMGRIAPQKLEWLFKQGITYKPNLVPGKRHKYKYATENSIIIDDTKSVIDDWNDAGGIGILHVDAETTIRLLRLLV